MHIYFDNSATTRVDDEVIKAIEYYYKDLYSNPSAMHRFGFLAEKEVKNANQYLASIINSTSEEIIWTSGGSESNNLAAFGYLYSSKNIGKHIITTCIEHSSVLKVFESLEKDGFEVSYLKVDSEGHIDINELQDLIRDDTAFVSIMYVNNEIGSVQNIDLIGNVIKNKNPKTIFHVDFVQGFGKYRVDVKKSKIDFLSMSSHKFHGPKGVGVLYKNKNVRIKPMILGGGQQNGLRAGTLNVPGILGTMVAAKFIYENFDKNFKNLLELKTYLYDNLISINDKYGGISLNTKNDDGFAPHIISVSFEDIKSEVMLHALEEYEIYVSAGSACSTHDKKTSATLSGIGLKNEAINSTIRISFGKYNTKEEIDKFIEVLNILIPKLRLKK